MASIDFSAPLDGVVVVDASTGLGSYCGRLLADLGAQVHRVGSDRFASPHRASFMNAGKIAASHDCDVIGLLAGAHLLVTDEGPAELTDRGLSPNAVAAAHPALVHVAISPFGMDGPYADRPATDLTLLAAGGLLALAGDPDRAPVRAWGEQTSVIAGTHAAVAALIALDVLEVSGVGQFVDVSVQEAVAHSLENAAQYLDLEGVTRRRVGAGPREAGTGLFTCRDGFVYLVGGLGGSPLAWDQIVAWLDDAGVANARELADGRWEDSTWRRSTEAVELFREQFESFADSRTKRDLVGQGQRRGISIAPVATPEDLLRDPQLLERSFFRTVDMDGHDVLLPGSPYRFRYSDVQPRAGSTPAAGRSLPCSAPSR
ncbi:MULTISPECIES: CoA transferase [Nocardioides]|uniref:CoA transferase n=1 Tax=Nocardioides vastitatis TaxID=2568655 RepID=A0ABW0ZEH8_9ACTN|nr:CoA transferase [Nocardioides sp.]THI96859.1 CoA transferase [Nocardioides sp.]